MAVQAEVVASQRNKNTGNNNKNNRVPLFTNSGRELLLDLKRSTQQNSSSACGGGGKNVAPVLPTYNNKLVQSCLQDLHGTNQELNLLVRLREQELEQQAANNSLNNSNNPIKPGMSDRPSILLHDKTLRRHKQCLLAYHHYRMEIIKDIQRSKMAANDIIASSTCSTGTGNSCSGSGTGSGSNNNGNGGGPISTNAQEVEFARGYASLREQYSNQVFELDLLPPTSHMVQVRVVQNIGQVVLPDSGRSITMTKGACLFLDRADCTDFLRQGLVQLYDGEEVDF